MENDTKMMLTKTAARLFLRQGYPGTGISQILREAHVPKGSLYYHFPGGKEDLAVAAVSLIREESMRRIRRRLDGVKDIVSGFQKLLYAAGDASRTDVDFNPYRISLILLEAGENGGRLRDVCQETYRVITSLYAEILTDRGYDQKEAEKLGSTVSMLIDGIAVGSQALGTEEPAEIAAQQLAVLMERHKPAENQEGMRVDYRI